MNKTTAGKVESIIILVCLAVALAALVLFSKGFMGEVRYDTVQYVDFNKIYSHQISGDSQIRALVSRNPTNDALSAFDAGDRRFVGVFSIGVEAPGLEALEKTNHAFIDSNGVKIISGTADYSRSALTAEVNVAAEKYASVYNVCLLKLLLPGNQK